MLIILEGLPGTGKTTLARKLAKRFRGILIPQIILSSHNIYQKFPPMEKEKFFIRNDLEKYKKASQGLKKKKWVIMDRGIFSTLAYNYAFTCLEGINTYKMVRDWYEKNKKIFILPQIIIFLEIPLITSLKRKNRLTLKMERKKLLWVNHYFLKEMKAFYHKFLKRIKDKNIRILKINAKKPLKKVFNEICLKIEELQQQL
jgi:thymidylate kinase